MIKDIELLDLLICAKLTSFHRCGDCKSNFSEKDGLPALFPNNGKNGYLPV